MQYFKGDAEELKFVNAALPTINLLDLDKDNFLNEAYQVQALGGVIFDNNRSPLANAIPREIFIGSFKEIFDAFIKVGTFEAYLTVFRKIFGTTVDVTFTVPAPGKLEILIEADGAELSSFIARYIDDNDYVYDTVVDHDDNIICFQTIKGFQSQYDLEQMLFEMVPAGIWTNITLTLGA